MSVFVRRTSPLLPIAVVAALIALAPATGWLVAGQRQYLVLALYVVVPVLLVTLRYFTALVPLIPLVALSVPFSLPTGTESRISAAMLLVMLLAGVWTASALGGFASGWRRSLVNRPLICFTAVCCLAFVWSIIFRDPLLVRFDRFTFVQLAGLLAMILSPIATLLIANFTITKRGLWWVAGLFLVAGVADTAARVVGVSVPGLNTRGLFPLWFVAVGYAVLIGQPRLHPLVRTALLVVLALQLYFVAVVNILWLSGWVPAVIAILAITLFRSRKAFMVLVLVGALMVYLRWDVLYTSIYQDSADEGDFQRLTLWQLNLELLEQHPLLGTGPAGYALYYISYHPSEARSTHNNYLDIIAQTGVIGTLCWVWLVVAVMREARFVLRRAPPGVYRTLALACAGGLVGAAGAMALGDWVLPFVYNQGIEGYRYTIFSWVFLGVLVSIRQQLESTTAPSLATEAPAHVAMNEQGSAYVAGSPADLGDRPGLQRRAVYRGVSGGA